MSSREVSGHELAELVAELRAGKPAAPAELRERVLARAGEQAVATPARRGRRWRWGWRRATLVLAPVALAGVAAAVVVGVVDSGGGSTLDRGSDAAQPKLARARPWRAASAPSPAGSSRGIAPVRPTPSRAQLYTADVSIRVEDASAATKKALTLTRSFGGYVRTVDYGKGQASGTADLVVRIPIGSVQTAIVKFSALGRILDQHVSVRDVQPSIDARFRRLQALREEIATLQRRLAAPGLTDEQKATLNVALTRTRGRLTALQRVQAQARKQASYATVALHLRTKAAQQVVPPAKPSRFDRTLDRIGDVLLVELEVVLYVLAIAVPLAALVALTVWVLRTGRRSGEQRLLAG